MTAVLTVIVFATGFYVGRRATQAGQRLDCQIGKALR